MLVENWLEEDEENREYYRKAKHYFDGITRVKKPGMSIRRARGESL